MEEKIYIMYTSDPCYAEDEQINQTANAVRSAARQQEVAFQFFAEGIILNIVGLLGICGNIISMVILSRPQMRSSINYLLVGLARCDTVLIITSILLFGFPAIYAYTGYMVFYMFVIYPFIAPFVYPLSLIAQTMSVYLTVTVTFERWVAVCHPLRARSYCTYGRARYYVLWTFIFSVVYNFTRFFEVYCCKSGQDHLTNMTLYEAKPTLLRRNQVYINVYINGMYLVFVYLVPFALLAVLNTAIYQQIRKANAERQRLSRLQKREIGLATMLLCVVAVFFICNILALVANVMESINDLIVDQLIKSSNLLVTVNSSVNFVIYVIYGEKFKRLFLRLFCPQGRILCNDAAPGGRDSPECDSVASNGEGRTYSVRSSMQMHRTNTTLTRNGSRAAGTCCNNRVLDSNGAVRTTSLGTLSSLGPCYYPNDNRAANAAAGNAAAGGVVQE